MIFMAELFTRELYEKISDNSHYVYVTIQKRESEDEQPKIMF